MPRFKLYEDPDYLYDEYVKKRKTAAQIGKENDCTEMTIYNHLKKNDLLKYKGKGRTLGRRVVKR